ncbi:MAG: autotransporter domain-containing protein [Deltaproteobacteria bacterium]|nr:autotransporter domain-containing protein [Deltaproteobacteria bacterium]
MKIKSSPLKTLAIIFLTFLLLDFHYCHALDFHGENDRFNVDIKMRPAIGYRRDNLVWNIAGDLNGENPNILSELEYNNLVIYQAGINAQIFVNQIYLKGSVFYGDIIRGECIDSDYHEDNRNDMFSESKSEAHDDNTFDLSMGMGYVFSFFKKRLHIAPLVGLAYHEQNLRITNGTQTYGIADLSGLNSTYQTEWQSMFAGIDIIIGVTHTTTFTLSGEYHDADYSAEADWNLRQDFQHPVSFMHDADGQGTTLKAGFEKALNKRWTIGLNYVRHDWSTEPGTDRVFFSNETTSETRLNEVKWESEAVNLSMGYRF